MICSLCNSEEVLNSYLGVCPTCAKTAGIVELPPSRRQPRPCRACDGRSFVRVVPREFGAEGGQGYAYSVPMHAVYPPTVRKHVFGGGASAEPISARDGGRGLMEMFICRGCEAVEWYCHGVETLPIGAAFNTELVIYPADGAYR